MADKAPRNAIWPEEMAERFGLKDAAAARWAASQTRRRREEWEEDQGRPEDKRQGKPKVTLMDFPEPDGRAKRTVTTAGGHTRVSISPYWLPKTVKAYETHKRGPGRRPNPEAKAS
jgi:hypothetical protein